MNVEKEDLSAFQCRRCGACCKWEGPVRVTEQEIDAIADYLGIELQRFIRDCTYLTPDRRSLSLVEKEDGSCFYYDDRRKCCLINPVKPKQCRDFPYRWNFSGWRMFCAGAGNLKNRKTVNLFHSDSLFLTAM